MTVQLKVDCFRLGSRQGTLSETPCAELANLPVIDANFLIPLFRRCADAAIVGKTRPTHERIDCFGPVALILAARSSRRGERLCVKHGDADADQSDSGNAKSVSDNSRPYMARSRG